MFLSIFNRKMWLDNVGVLNNEAIEDTRIFSHFDNTFPHIKIFSVAFANSKAYFNKEPLSVCLSGAREWAPMNPLVSSIRLVEALDEYRKNGLKYFLASSYVQHLSLLCITLALLVVVLHVFFLHLN